MGKFPGSFVGAIFSFLGSFGLTQFNPAGLIARLVNPQRFVTVNSLKRAAPMFNFQTPHDAGQECNLGHAFRVFA
jgi:hypothetical protein